MYTSIGLEFWITENWEIPPRTSAQFNVDFGECPVFDNLCKAITQQTNVKKPQCEPKVSLTQLGEASSAEGWKIGASAYSELGEAPEADKICCYYGSGAAFLWGSKSSL